MSEYYDFNFRLPSTTFVFSVFTQPATIVNTLVVKYTIGLSWRAFFRNFVPLARLSACSAPSWQPRGSSSLMWTLPSVALSST